MKHVVFGFIALVAAVTLFVFPQSGQGSATSDLPPVVGSWRLISDEEGVNVKALYTFGADGTLTATDLTGTQWHGAWQPAEGDRVAFVIEAINPDSTGIGQSGMFSVEEGANEVPFSGGHLERIVVEVGEEPAEATPTT